MGGGGVMAGGVAALVAGCAGLRSAERADQVYTLEAAAPAEPRAAAEARVATGMNEVRPMLQLLRPLAAPGLDSDRIAVVRNGSQLDFYAASRWPAPLPEVLQSLAINALRASGHYRAVQSEATAVAADEVLQPEIRRSPAQYRSR